MIGEVIERGHKTDRRGNRKATGFERALLMNFAARRLEYKRFMNTHLRSSSPSAVEHPLIGHGTLNHANQFVCPQLRELHYEPLQPTISRNIDTRWCEGTHKWEVNPNQSAASACC